MSREQTSAMVVFWWDRSRWGGGVNILHSIGETGNFSWSDFRDSLSDYRGR